jgi:hypothetical protein
MVCVKLPFQFSFIIHTQLDDDETLVSVKLFYCTLFEHPKFFCHLLPNHLRRNFFRARSATFHPKKEEVWVVVIYYFERGHRNCNGINRKFELFSTLHSLFSNFRLSICQIWSKKMKILFLDFFFIWNF